MNVPTIDHGNDNQPAQREWYREVPRSIRGYTIFGVALLIMTFGTFSAWALSGRASIPLH